MYSVLTIGVVVTKYSTGARQSTYAAFLIKP